MIYRESRVGFSWADDPGGDSGQEGSDQKLYIWRESLEKKGLRDNLCKTNSMVGGEWRNTKTTIVKWPRAVVKVWTQTHTNLVH